MKCSFHAFRSVFRVYNGPTLAKTHDFCYNWTTFGTHIHPHGVWGMGGGGGTHFSYNGKLKGEKKLKDCNIYPMNNENMNNEKP